MSKPKEVKKQVKSRFRKSFKSPVKESLKKALSKQLQYSNITNIDFKQYLIIAEYCIIKCQANIFSDTELRTFFQSKHVANMNQTQLDKTSYVLQLLNDWYHNKRSEKCKGITTFCNYCGSLTSLVDSKIIYGSSKGTKIYLCNNYPSCDAYVGVHTGDNWPLGTLANKELKAWRNKTHATLDAIWKNKKVTRTEAYMFLQEKMSLTNNDTHIAKFNIKQCKQAIYIIQNSYFGSG